MQRTKYLFMAGVLTAASVAVADVDALVDNCNDCHGPGGVSQWTDMPSIAGLSEFYHADQLYFFRDGDRPCSESEYKTGDTARPATTMCAVTADLSDDQLEAVAAHYAAMDWVPAGQEFDADLAAAGEKIHMDNCEICHSDGGSNPEDDAGILAGQWMGYLEDTLAQYRAGERDQPGAMQQKIDALSDDDVTALLHYYASRQ